MDCWGTAPAVWSPNQAGEGMQWTGNRRGMDSPGPVCGLDTGAVAASFGTTDVPCHCQGQVSKGYSHEILQVVGFSLSEADDIIISDTQCNESLIFVVKYRHTMKYSQGMLNNSKGIMQVMQDGKLYFLLCIK